MKYTKRNFKRTFFCSSAVISIASQYNGWLNVNTVSLLSVLAKTDTNDMIEYNHWMTYQPLAQNVLQW